MLCIYTAPGSWRSTWAAVHYQGDILNMQWGTACRFPAAVNGIGYGKGIEHGMWVESKMNMCVFFRRDRS